MLNEYATKKYVVCPVFFNCHAKGVHLSSASYILCVKNYSLNASSAVQKRLLRKELWYSSLRDETRVNILRMSMLATLT